MSLVERALKKIQDAREREQVLGPKARGAPSESVATVLQSELRPTRRPPSTAAPAPVPAKIVKVDRAALRSERILPSPQEERQLMDDYRRIKRPLIEGARGAEQLHNGHLIMVASALPGDGKTFTAINLALSMALERDTSVLLVDADVAKPGVSRIFGVDSEPGLLDLLRDEAADVQSTVLPTDVAGLSILPAGRASDTATELLASSRMGELVAMLVAQDPNRIILFDSPPLLLTSESRIVSTIVGQVVLVVRAHVTPQRAVLDAIGLLGEDKAVGLVLNGADEARQSDYYGYGDYQSSTVSIQRVDSP